MGISNCHQWVILVVIEGSSNNAVILVRVSASDQAPHAVDNRTKVYVRVDSQSRPELYRLATIDELQWLFDRREQGERHIYSLIETAQARADNVLSEGFDPLIAPFSNSLPTIDAWIARRFYFGNEAFLRSQAQLVLTDSSVRSSILNANWHFPSLSNYVDKERSVPGGYCVYTSDSNQRHPGIYEYVELNTLGVLFTKMRINTSENDQGGHVLPLDWILPPLDGLIKFAYQSFKDSKLWGLVQVNVSFSGLTDSVLRMDKNHQYSDLRKHHISLDYSLDLLDMTVDVSALEEVRPSLIKEVASKLLWAFGYDWIDTAFEKWWKGIRK